MTHGRCTKGRYLLFEAFECRIMIAELHCQNNSNLGYVLFFMNAAFSVFISVTGFSWDLGCSFA